MDPTYWREQAQRCLRLADAIGDEKTKITLLELAAEYDERADAEEIEAAAAET